METISFAGDGLAPELVPAEELADCAATALGEDGKRILSYGTGAGYTPLRELVAERFGVHPSRVLLTNGWLQGFSFLIDGRVNAQSVIVEYPTYDRALQLLFRQSANLVYMDIREEGPGIDLLEAHIRTLAKPAFAYLVPTFHNPTGQCLTEDERNRIGLLLFRRDALIVEDDSYGLLRYAGEPIRTMFDLSEKSIVYSSSFSYTVAPGLRVGAFILTEELAAELAAKANATYITPTLLGQATVFEFMRRGSFESNLVRLTGELLERRDAALAALEGRFDGCTWSRPDGGIFLALALPDGMMASDLLARASGVTADSGGELGGFPNIVRLNFAGPAKDEVGEGISRLAAAYAAVRPD
jgi:DNA-binding transcriptional MocR family regulator